MKHLRTFESFDQEMVHNNEYPSIEDMKAYVCGCGYDEMEVEEMTHSQVCSAYDTCKMEMNEARKYKKKKASKKMPDIWDINKNGDKKEPISKAYKDVKDAKDKGAQKKTQSQAQGKLSAAQKKLPPALQKAIANKKK
jgi:hypothetical protein